MNPNVKPCVSVCKDGLGGSRMWREGDFIDPEHLENTLNSHISGKR